MYPCPQFILEILFFKLLFAPDELQVPHKFSIHSHLHCSALFKSILVPSVLTLIAIVSSSLTLKTNLENFSFNYFTVCLFLH